MQTVADGIGRRKLYDFRTISLLSKATQVHCIPETDTRYSCGRILYKHDTVALTHNHHGTVVGVYCTSTTQ